MKHPSWISTTIALSVCLLLSAANLFASPNNGKLTTNPDFTRGGQKDDYHDWTLGPTGLRGWIFGSKVQTCESRQILVTAVAKGSPADGIFMTDDVIVGLGTQPFQDDARVSLAKAITAAESEQGGGKLRLLRWRAGKTEPVNLNLTVMGTYSDTAPFDCPKSKKVFELGCDAIAKRKIGEVSIASDMNALALLASGKAEYQPMLAAYAKLVADHRFGGYVNWEYGYACMFLAEYVLATGDRSVFEGLKRITLEIVKGQSAVGTWGHYPAFPNGNLEGYGCMNQPGLSLTISLVLARAAGVKEPALDRAIAKASGFLRWYANKGAIPYGDHQPWDSHEDGGKCSSAAVLFDLLGDREAAEFFAKMAAAAYAERENGHSGNYFNILWSLPGVIRCGPLTSGAYLKELSWYYDLARGWDGSVAYQGEPQGGEEMNKHTTWDCTGSFLLAFAAPKQSLYLLGKKPFAFPALNQAQTDEVIAAGRDFTPSTQATCYDGRTTEQLLAGLTSWSPGVRGRSASSLARREGDFVPALLKMLAGSNRDARYGACLALVKLGPKADAAAPQLRVALKDADPWVQYLTCQAIAALSPAVRATRAPDLLTLAVTPNPNDPRRMVQRAVGYALFSPPPGVRGTQSILATSLDGVDRRRLFPAMKAILQNDDGAARGSVGGIYSKLTEPDVATLLPAILKACERKAPSGEMFGDGIRVAGMELLSRRHIREGMAVCLLLIPGRTDNALECLKRYGVHAQSMVPQLRELSEKYKKLGSVKAAIDKTIPEIQAAKDAPQLVSMSEFIAKNKTAKQN